MPEKSRSSLLVVFLTVFTDLLGFGMVLPLLPVYGSELMAGYGKAQTGLALGLLMTCYSIMQLGFAPLWGRLSDRVGRRPILILGLAGSTLFYGLFGLATMYASLTWMFLSRIGGGIAGATIPTAQAYIADVTPKHERTRGMALIGVAFGLWFTFGPLLGALALAMTPEKAHLSPWPGFTASILSFSALSLAVVKLRESLPPDAKPQKRRYLDFAAFWQAIRVPSISPLLATVFFCAFGFSAFEGALALVLADFLGIQRGGNQILLAFAYIGLVQTLVQGGLVRWMARFTSEGALSVIGTVLTIGGYLGMAIAADPERGGAVPLMIMASLVVSGLGFVYPSVQSLLSRRSDPTRQGGILGVSSGVNSLARILGMLVAMMLYKLAGQTTPFWTAFALMCLTLLLVVLAVRGGKDWTKDEQETSPAVADG